MKHQFTEDDLKQALRHTAYMDDGLRINIPAWVEDNDEVDTGQVDVFRAILDALPEPEPVADEWEQCTFADVEATDEAVLFEFKNGSKIQGKPGYRNATNIDYWVGYELQTMSLSSLKKGKGIVYRIPAPVRHPNPEQHPVIMGVVTRDGSNHDFGVRNWSTYHVYSDGQSKGFIHSDQITDWEPAKIVRTEEK